MRNEIYNFEGFKYIRVTARTATKLFNDGQPVALLAYNFKPGPWVHPAPITNAKGDTLQSWINAYSYYNCNAEAGKSVKYFRITKM